MKFNLLLLLTTFIITLNTEHIYAQCSTKVTYEETHTAFLNDFEDFTDLFKIYGARRGMVYQVSLNRYVNTSIDLDSISLFIISFEAGSNSDFTIPRRITINFINRLRISIEASSIDTNYNNGSPYYITRYEISSEDRKKLRSPIRSLILSDNRTNKSLSLSPDYSRILNEQLSCLDKSYRIHTN